MSPTGPGGTGSEEIRRGLEGANKITGGKFEEQIDSARDSADTAVGTE
ncbi:hypothetical protein ABIB54_001051 [Frigoribacterium sp. UYMn621]